MEHSFGCRIAVAPLHQLAPPLPSQTRLSHARRDYVECVGDHIISPGSIAKAHTQVSTEPKGRHAGIVFILDEYTSGSEGPQVSCLFLNYYCHAEAVLDLTVQDTGIPDRLTFSFLHVEAISGLAGRRRCQVRQPVLDTTHQA